MSMFDYLLTLTSVTSNVMIALGVWVLVGIALFGKKGRR